MNGNTETVTGSTETFDYAVIPENRVPAETGLEPAPERDATVVVRLETDDEMVLADLNVGQNLTEQQKADYVPMGSETAIYVDYYVMGDVGSELSGSEWFGFDGGSLHKYAVGWAEECGSEILSEHGR